MGALPGTPARRQASLSVSYRSPLPGGKTSKMNLKSHVPESVSQIIPNEGKTGANGGPKFERFLVLKLLKKIAFYPKLITFFFR